VAVNKKKSGVARRAGTGGAADCRQRLIMRRYATFRISFLPQALAYFRNPKAVWFGLTCMFTCVQYVVHIGGSPVDAITYSAARAKLADTMDRVCEDHEAIIITRSGQQSVVMMSLDDYKALEETSYLLRSPKNARRLLESIASLETGEGNERKLAE
jgi:antitoxin YefM